MSGFINRVDKVTGRRKKIPVLVLRAATDIYKSGRFLSAHSFLCYFEQNRPD